jgi:hypothetical protein
MVGGAEQSGVRTPHGRVCKVHLREALMGKLDRDRLMLHPHGVCYRGGRCRTEDIFDERAARLMTTILEQYGKDHP